MGKKQQKGQETYGQKVAQELTDAVAANQRGDSDGADRLANQAMEDMAEHGPDDPVTADDSDSK